MIDPSTLSATQQLFDQIIYGSLAVGVIFLTILSAITRRTGRYNRRRILNYLSYFIMLCVALVAYGSFVEPKIITLNHQQIDYCQIRETCFEKSLNIVLVSDWHVGPYKQEDFVERAVEKINLAIPDFVVIPGDFVYAQAGEAHLLEPLSDITVPIYASLGNHDYNQYEQGIRHANTPEPEVRQSDTIAETIEAFNVTVLRNEATVDPETSVVIVGQEDWWARPFVSAENIRIPDGELTIFLQHNPDGAVLDNLPQNIDLVLSGHTHGGQIRLPYIGPLAAIPTEIGNDYDQGWFDLDEDTRLFITRGIGESGPRARLFAWPEIVVLTITY